jgi:hypothetical protein
MRPVLLSPVIIIVKLIVALVTHNTQHQLLAKFQNVSMRCQGFKVQSHPTLLFIPPSLLNRPSFEEPVYRRNGHSILPPCFSTAPGQPEEVE